MYFLSQWHTSVFGGASSSPEPLSLMHPRFPYLELHEDTYTTETELQHCILAGIQDVGDLFQEGSLASFQDLMAVGNLHPGQFLFHKTLVASLTAKWGTLAQEPPMHYTLQYLHVMGNGRHLIRWFAFSLRHHTETDLTRIRQHWEEARGREFTDREWAIIRGSPTYIPRNQRFRQIQFFVLHRAYLNPAQINRFFLCGDTACPAATNLMLTYSTCSGTARHYPHIGPM